MSFHVQRQMITPWKRSCAKFTFERLLTCVFSIVPCKLVWPGKFPLAALPWTLVWLLSCVCPLVRLQVWALCIDFVTIEEITLVNFPLFQAISVITCWKVSRLLTIFFFRIAGWTGRGLDHWMSTFNHLDLRSGWHQQLLRQWVWL